MPHISERQDALRAIREAITVTVLAQAVTEMAERNGVVGGSAGGVAEVVAGALRFDPDPDQEEETIDLLAEAYLAISAERYWGVRRGGVGGVAK